MKAFIAFLLLVISVVAQAEDKMKWNYKNEEITKLIEDYSKASGQRFIVDSTVRGRITILNPDDVPLSEAFNQLSEALAINGFAMVKKDDVLTVKNARSSQRDGIEVFNKEVPKAKPQRMVTWIANIKNVSVLELKSQIGRLLNSSYGEIEALEKTNQLIVTDWTSSIARIADVVKEMDMPADPKLTKLNEKYRADRKNDRHIEKIVKIKDDKDEEKIEKVKTEK